MPCYYVLACHHNIYISTGKKADGMIESVHLQGIFDLFTHNYQCLNFQQGSLLGNQWKSLLPPQRGGGPPQVCK